MTTEAFHSMVRAIPKLGMDWHRDTLLVNSTANKQHMHKSVREIRTTARRTLIASAGPSLRRNLQEYTSTPVCVPLPAIVAVDGAYVACLEAGVIPDYVITLDPHPTRIVRWFGDPELEAHTADDYYFARQDLDEAFRADMLAVNAKNIDLVDEHTRHYTKLIICSAAPANVVERTSKFDRYWFAPLIDSPKLPGSLTRSLARITGLPSLNTGGTVGTAAIMFAHCVLKARSIAVIGMDLGYAKDLPLERTQSWNMLKDKPNVADYYPRVQHPQWGECYVDPTYHAYKANLLGLLKAGNIPLHNCTGAGALFGQHVRCGALSDWLHG